MLNEKASTCAVVTTTCAAARPSGGSETTTFAIRRWRPGYLNYHWRYDEWAADIEAVEVRAIGVRGDKTFLVLDGRVDVYGLGGDGRVHVLHRVETCSARPLCAASRAAPVAIAYTGSEVGEVRVERWAAAAGGFAPLSSFRAHSSRLGCVAVSWDGRFVATASFKGTIVRVFHAADGMLLRELRRGADRADIYSMAFSPDSKWLAVSSDKGTIHVFSVNVDVSSSSPAQEDTHNPDSDSPNAGSALNAKQPSWYFFSGFVPGYFRQDGSLAKFRLREGVKYVVAFSHHEPNTVLVIGMDGRSVRPNKIKSPPTQKPCAPSPTHLPPPPTRTRHEASRREGDNASIREAVQIHRAEPEAPPGSPRGAGPRRGARPLLPPPPPQPRLLRLRGAGPPRHRRVAPAPRRRGHAHRQVNPPRRVPPHGPRARPPRRARAPPRLAQARHRALLPLRQFRAQVLPRARHRERQGRGRGGRHVHGRRPARVRHRGEVGAGLQEGRHQRRRRAAPGGRRGVPPQGGGAHVRSNMAMERYLLH